MPDTLILPAFTVGSQQGPFNPSNIANAALGPHAEMLFSKLDADYRIGVKNGETFFASNQASTAWSVALATAYTGLVVYNPVTSKKNLSILKVSFSPWSAPTTITAIGLMGGYGATGVLVHTTPLTVYNAKTLVAGGGYGGADASATLVGAEIWFNMLSSANATGTLPVSGSPGLFNIDGAYEVPPGGYIALGSQTIASGVGSMWWREVDP